MGWEAIEQYLSEVEQQCRGFIQTVDDQQVPQPMIKEECDIMFTDRGIEQPYIDYLPVEPSAISATPVNITETAEANITRTDAAKYYDLDHDNSSFYDDCVTQSQCLNIKQEPNTDSYHEQYGCQGNDFLDNQEQIYLSMTSRIFHDLMYDVQTTCSALRISHDPSSWCTEDVRRWIAQQCRQFNYPLPNVDSFQVTGGHLCQMSESEFKVMAPDSGSTLYSQLDIWKSVMEQAPSHYFPANSPPQSFIQIPAADTRCASSPGSVSPHGSVSPSPSNHSEEMGSPSVMSRLQPGEWPADETMTSEYADDIMTDEHHHPRQSIHLWQFLRQLLLKPQFYNDCIRWIDQSRGIFKIENSSRVAKLWGRRKNRPAMNYDKLSRSIRQYYKKRIIMKTEQSKRLVYQFCPEYL